MRALLLAFLGLLSRCEVGAYATEFTQGNAPPGPVVDVGYASFLGNSSIPGVDFFGGIRYVEPPLGDLRFRAPQLLDETPREHNITDARKWRSICIQQPAQVGFGSEDCLTLNVWKSSNTKAGDNLPVALYIHSAQGFPMNTWITESNGSIVAVNIQYRLGLFGFLASTAVQQDGDLNAGLLDQRAALGWVKRHIASFGGDPNQITVSGQSAGSADIVHQMVSYGGEGEAPFQAAVAQSIGMDPLPTSEQYEYCFANATSTVNCTSSSNATVMSCLRAAPLSALVDAINNRPSSCGYLPVVDGVFLPDLPSRLLTQGRFHMMPFIGGHVTDDGSIFVGNPADFVNTTEGFVASLRKRYTMLSNATAQRMIELYPESDFPSQWERAKRAFGDTVFTCMDWSIANKLLSEGRTDAYNYRFNTPDPVQLAANPWEGVMHTSELFFLFQGRSGPSPTDPVAVFAPFNASEQALATETIGYWTSFARAFNPNTYKPLASSPVWPDALSGRLVIQEGGVNATSSYLEQRTSAYVERCLFWNEVGNETRV
ncbi:carboxyesterase [Wolfiporia cocos MD-104 SS10]|uniref:Carboxylic ester hydrolase n=1 Tax=Wolfiporia cocos (strain MD-104) TaxID=742152 RepID=A0A2H3J2K8_WOLCO|nr:carboxyesterase [Wolfiporia cocos MD-104 SS10]